MVGRWWRWLQGALAGIGVVLAIGACRPTPTPAVTMAAPTAAPTATATTKAVPAAVAGAATAAGRTVFLPAAERAEAQSPATPAAAPVSAKPATKPVPNQACRGIAVRSGQDLVVDGQPVHFFGVNIPYLLAPEFPESQVEPIVTALSERGVNALRVWFFEHHDPDRFARLLDIGQRHGVRFVVVLEDNVNKGQDWFFGKDDEKKYRPHLERTVSRFKDRPEILFWEVINEPNCGEGRHDDNCLKTIRSWLTMAAEMVKSIDSCHAVSSGMIGVGNFDNEKDHYRKVQNKDAIEVVSVHRRAVDNSDAERQVAQDANRPIYYGEVYFKAYDDGCGALSGNDSPRQRAKVIKGDLRDSIHDGVAGYLLWDFSANRVELTNGSERDYCSSFGYPLDDPLWSVLQEAGLPRAVPWR